MIFMRLLMYCADNMSHREEIQNFDLKCGLVNTIQFNIVLIEHKYSVMKIYIWGPVGVWKHLVTRIDSLPKTNEQFKIGCEVEK